MFDYLIESINEYTFDFLKENVSPTRIEKACRLRFEEDKKRSLTVEYALNKLLLKHFPNITTPVEITYGSNGKPSLSSYYQSVLNNAATTFPTKSFQTPLHISLSHSGDYVAVIISDSVCGIDIEKDTRDLTKIANRFFTADELDSIRCPEDYLKIWTLKESIMKATGKGLSLGMESFSVANKICNIGNTSYECFSAPAPEGYALSYVLEMNN